MSRIFQTCLVLAVGWSMARAEEPSKAAVKKLADEMGAATIAGDYSKIVDSMYPAGVELLGGREAAIKIVEEGMKQLKDQGITFVKYEVSEPGDFHTEGANTFVIVPTKLTMKFPAGKILASSYLLGISGDGGKTWKFVDGAGAKKKEARDKILPKLPAKLELPKYTEPEIIKDK